MYIGKTKRGVALRWKEHLYHVKIGRQTQLCRAIRKYGQNDFTISVLDWAENDLHANWLESFYIGLTRSHHPESGYNGTYGGDGVVPTEATKQKMREGQKVGHLRGEQHPMFGKKLSSHHSQRLRTLRLGKKGYYRNEFKASDLVDLYNAGHSMRALSRQFKIDRGTVKYRLLDVGIKINSERRT